MSTERTTADSGGARQAQRMIRRLAGSLAADVKRLADRLSQAADDARRKRNAER